MNDNNSEGWGCYVTLAAIGFIAWIAMAISTGGSSYSSTSTTPNPATHTYTPPPRPINTYPTACYPPAPIVSEPAYDTNNGVETPDDAYDNGYDEGYAQGLEDGRRGT